MLNCVNSFSRIWALRHGELYGNHAVGPPEITISVVGFEEGNFRNGCLQCL